jgi:hypothetical protein
MMGRHGVVRVESTTAYNLRHSLHLTHVTDHVTGRGAKPRTYTRKCPHPAPCLDVSVSKPSLVVTT